MDVAIRIRKETALRPESAATFGLSAGVVVANGEGDDVVPRDGSTSSTIVSTVPLSPTQNIGSAAPGRASEIRGRAAGRPASAARRGG